MCRADVVPDSPLIVGVGGALASNIVRAAGPCKAGMPVVFTRMLYGAGGRAGGLFYRKCQRSRPALDALQHGFGPYAMRHACGYRAVGPHGASLFDLQAKYAEMVGESEIIALFTR